MIQHKSPCLLLWLHLRSKHSEAIANYRILLETTTLPLSDHGTSTVKQSSCPVGYINSFFRSRFGLLQLGKLVSYLQHTPLSQCSQLDDESVVFMRGI